jgi:hypothetical protein
MPLTKPCRCNTAWMVLLAGTRTSALPVAFYFEFIDVQ